MNQSINRRQLLHHSLTTAAALSATATLGGAGRVAAEPAGNSTETKKTRKYNLGLVTYLIAAEWDLPTIIRRCPAAGIHALEFRTTHKHGIEPSLSKAERADVKKRCADGGLIIWSLGTACDFHSPDPAQLRAHIDTALRFVDLAHDLGAPQIKVRPNGLPPEVSEEKTLEQIGGALRTLGQAGADANVLISCEVHGRGTQHPPRMRKIMEIADHPAVGVTWNSNAADIKDGSVKDYFDLLSRWIFNVHITELISDYPYRELFTLLNGIGYEGYTMIEAPGLETTSEKDSIRFLKYYKALWEQLSQPASR
ncbi:MAG: sugar phosphate isomerase/epimerase [Phycisphaerales bacterium]|nr:sugar phosphate isomerase/epimerase [Phycisphaerales bacterium]